MDKAVVILSHALFCVRSTFLTYAPSPVKGAGSLVSTHQNHWEAGEDRVVGQGMAPLRSVCTLGKLLKPLLPQIPHLENGINNNASFTEVQG